jgi:hypothetical protein
MLRTGRQWSLRVCCLVRTALRCCAVGWESYNPGPRERIQWVLSVDVLPEGLLTLVLGHYFNQPLPAGVLPASLKELQFGDHCGRCINVSQPPSQCGHLRNRSKFRAACTSRSPVASHEPQLNVLLLPSVSFSAPHLPHCLDM